jgi:predicted amidohydrolase
MKVAAYQAPIAASDPTAAIDLVREQLAACESAGVQILCCPEAILGGLADYAPDPRSIAIDVEGGRLNDVLRPLASDRVTTIIGFTEIDDAGTLFNSAAVLHRGTVIGVYRKHHPAINRSVYAAGESTPTFTVGALRFGIIICRDSTFTEPAKTMASQGATVLFIPTNNALPATKGGPKLVVDAGRCDTERATENRVTVVRSDVAGHAGHLVSYGSTGVVGPDGTILARAAELVPELVIVEIGDEDRRLTSSLVSFNST